MQDSGAEAGPAAPGAGAASGAPPAAAPDRSAAPLPAAAPAASMFSQQLVEQKEREVQESLTAKFAQVRVIEQQLAQLQLQLKLTGAHSRGAGCASHAV